MQKPMSKNKMKNGSKPLRPLTKAEWKQLALLVFVCVLPSACAKKPPIRQEVYKPNELNCIDRDDSARFECDRPGVFSVNDYLIVGQGVWADREDEIVKLTQSLSDCSSLQDGKVK